MDNENNTLNEETHICYRCGNPATYKNFKRSLGL